MKQKCHKENKFRRKYNFYFFGNLIKILQNRKSRIRCNSADRSAFFVKFGANCSNNSRNNNNYFVKIQAAKWSNTMV